VAATPTSTSSERQRLSRQFTDTSLGCRHKRVPRSHDGGKLAFTSWLAHVFPSQWNAFCAKVHPGITPPCGPTVLYPQFGRAKSENGSSSVASYIASSFGNGAIGYDEYLYAVGSRQPVLALQNPAGDYVQPTPVNVSAALTHALINENPGSPQFLQEDLNPVYASTDPLSYPLSSYSYLIAPRAGTRLPPNFTTAKGQTLSILAEFALCHDRTHLAQLGYAPLPANLVAGGLLEVKSIPGHVAVPAHCQ
jgi:ABC-type phosphate transport system substrate-binding protein